MTSEQVRPVDFTEISENYRQAVNQILRNVHMRRYSVLIGPRFCGKSSVLRVVAKKLQDEERIRLIINMHKFKSPSLSQFYKELANDIKDGIGLETGCSVLPFHGEEKTGKAFGDYLLNILQVTKQNVTLILDHIESLPSEFCIPLLLTLRRVYNQQSSPERIIMILASSLSLASLTLGPNSPFNIAETIAIGELTEQDEFKLIDIIMKNADVQISANARSKLRAATSGDPKLLYSVSQICLDRLSEIGSSELTITQVNNAIELFLEQDIDKYLPIEEALQAVEKDSELFDSLLLLLDRGEVSRQELLLTPSADLDKLYLTGLVLKSSEGKYRLKNEIYSQYLKYNYDPGKIGRLLSRLGEWDKAIDRLETLVTSDKYYLEDLLDVVNRAMNSSINISQAVRYLHRGLSAGFGILDMELWRLDTQNHGKRIVAHLVKVPVNHEVDRSPTAETLPLDQDTIETQTVKEKHIVRWDELKFLKRSFPLIVNDKVFGVITITEQTSPYTSNLEDMLTFLDQAAIALRSVHTRQSEIIPQNSRSVQDDRRMLLIMQRVTHLIQTLQSIEKSLHLLLTVITAHFGLGFNRVWLFLFDPKKSSFVGRMAIGHFSDKEARTTWSRIKKFSFEEYVQKIKTSAEIELTPIDGVTRSLSIPLDSDGQDLFSYAFIHPAVYRLRADSSHPLPILFKDSFDVEDACVAPLISSGECIGLIAADNRFSVYKKPDEEMLLALSNLAAAAVTNDRQKTEESQRTLLAETLSEISQRLTRIHNQEEIFSAILDQMKHLQNVGLLPFNTASIQLHQSQRKVLKIVDCLGFTDFTEVNGLEFSLDGNFPNVKVYKSRTPLIYSDIQREYPHFSTPKFHVVNVKGWMGVPLQIGENVLGVLTLDSYQPDTYNNQHQRIASIFANITATALENARLYEEQKRLNKDLSGLNQTALEMAEHLAGEAPNFLKSLVESICKLADADCAVIYPVKLGNQLEYDLQNIAHYGLIHPEKFVPQSKDFFNPGNPNQLVLNRKALFVDDVANFTDLTFGESEFIRREEIRSFVGICIELAGKTRAILYVNFRKPRVFDDRTTEVYIQFIKLAGIMLLNATILNENNEELARTIDMMGKVQEIDKLISSTLDLTPILIQILSGAFNLTKAVFGRVILINPENPHEFNIEYQLSKDSSNPEYLSSKAVRIPFHHDQITVLDLPIYPEMKSYIQAPLLVESQTLGFIQVESVEQNAFSEENRQLLDWLAVDAALAIHNAQRYEELKRVKDKATFNLYMAFLGLWGADFKHTIDQSILGMRSWLYAIKNVLNETNIDKNKISNYLKEMEDVISQTQQIRISEDFPDVQIDQDERIVRNRIIIVDTELESLLRCLCDKHLNIKVEIVLGCPGVGVRIEPKTFEIAVEKVVHNALKAMNWNGNLTVWSQIVNDSFVEIHFKDDGPGIPEEEQPYFLNHPIDNSVKGSGGYGAWMAKFIAVNHDGDLTLVKTGKNLGTELCLKLPAVLLV